MIEVINKDHEMPLKHLWLLGRAPSFSNKPVYIRSKHGTGVINTKEWIPFDSLKLPLTHDGAPLREIGLMLGLGKMLSNERRIKRVLIRSDGGKWVN